MKINLNYNLGWKKISIAVVSLILFIIVFNFMAFIIPILQNCVGRPYPQAKIYLVSAATINNIYIFPLSKTFGYKNKLTLPFYKLRDYLYSKGLALYPENEGEREVQWFNVRFAEYVKLIYRIEKDYEKGKKYALEIEPMLIAWSNELYSHLEPFSSLPIKDKKLRKLRYNMFIGYAYFTRSNKYYFTNRLLLNKANLRRGLPIYKNKNEMNEYEKILYYCDKLKEYVKKNEKEGLDYFYNKTENFYFENLIKYHMSRHMIEYRFASNEFNCSDPYVKMYGKSFVKLLKAAKDPRVTHTDLAHRSVFFWTYDQEKALKMCPEERSLDKLREMIFTSKTSKDLIEEL